MTKGLASLLPLFRTAALVAVAALLLLRLGPFCEATAQAAPLAPAMTGCDGKGSDTPAKKVSVSACTTPCTAVRGEPLARVEPAPALPIAPWPSASSSLVGLPVPPATPPPRSA